MTLSHVAHAICKATSHSYGARQNSTLRNFVLLGRLLSNFYVIDYVGDPYSYAIFG